jgi:subtilisin family serine protease
MKILQNYIVLKRNKTTAPTFEHLGRGAPSFGTRDAQPENLEVIHTELSPGERNDLRRDPRTCAIAVPMPMTLIAPIDAQPADDSQPDASTWGVGAVGALETAYTGKGITVAVLDTGIDPNHSAFQGVTLVRRNFTEESDDDLHGHGTHCAGTIFGRDVNNMRIGVASGVERAIIGKVLGNGGGSSATIAQAIQWAVNEGAHVISMSLGIDFPGYVQRLVDMYGLKIAPATSLALEAYRANINLFRELTDFVTAQSMFSHGTVITAASGNESNRPQYEIAVSPPAAAQGIVSVGALQQTDAGLAPATFSNTQVDISAPGVNIISARPGGGLARMSGTSMATPHVAGIAALWSQRQLEKTGIVNGSVLQARLISSGVENTMAPGAEAEDIGTGIVQAPRD